MRVELWERSFALSNETRIKLLLFLSGVTTINITELSLLMKLKTNVCGKHLEILAEAGFVEKVVTGKYTFVRLSNEGLNDFARRLVDVTKGKTTDEIWT